MCGLAGYFGRNSSAVDPDGLRRAADALFHRGPDGGGQWESGGFGLSHRRLAILDPSDRGRQPMASRSGRFVIAFNGEIYNFHELASELSIDMRSGSDTEVLVNGFEKIGLDILPRLNGIFAFAIVDTLEQKGWLVRDRMGVKPLYLARTERGLIFGSEIKALFALDSSFAKNLSLESLHEWAWYGNALGGRTLFDGIDELEPGVILEYDLASGIAKRDHYFTIAKALETRVDLDDLSDSELATRVSETLERAITRQLVSDVPVGVFLSGGIDSSAITAFASHHYPGRLETFSVAFDHDREGSELERAARVAKRYGTVHHEVDIALDEHINAAERLVAHHDLPFSDAANIPLMLLSGKVAGTHKVILQGDGGDELFGGYSRYRTVPKLARWRSAAALAAPIARLLPASKRGDRARRYIEALNASDTGELFALLLTVERQSKPPAAIFGPRIRAAIAGEDPFRRYREVAGLFADHPVADRLFYTDMSVILPDIFLPKVDRSTMACSVEVRVPFLDNDLVDLSLAIPARRKLHGNAQKGLLKRALAGIVDDEVLFGAKRGFGVPFGRWIVGPLAERMTNAVEAANGQIPGLFDEDYLDRLTADHRRGRADNSFILWKAFNLALWVERYRVGLAA